MVEEKKEVTVVVSPVEMAKELLEKNVKPEDLEKVLNLQERFDAIQAKKAYHVAMTAFKANPPEIVKDKEVSYTGVSYKHASLANVTSKINEALNKCGLSASWQTKQNGSIGVTCKITHILGHSEETTLFAEADSSGSKNKIQAIGSTITYLQRYTLLSLTGIAAGDDDDGRESEPTEYIDDKQLSQIRDYIDNEGVDEPTFLDYMGIDSVEKMPKNKFQVALSAMEQRKKEKSA